LKHLRVTLSNNILTINKLWNIRDCFLFSWVVYTQITHFCLPVDNWCLRIYVCIMIVNMGNKEVQRHSQTGGPHTFKVHPGFAETSIY
jgi:hypothetical protein